MTALLSLAERWREEAGTLRRYGDERGAHVCELHAREIEEAVRAAESEILTLEQAEQESGYSREHLRHLVAGGKVPNAGKRGSPRIRRGDLPRRPKKERQQQAGGVYQAWDDALNIVQRLGSP